MKEVKIYSININSGIFSRMWKIRLNLKLEFFEMVIFIKGCLSLLYFSEMNKNIKRLLSL